MANWFCINKSGKTYNVVDGNDKRIGSIGPNEAFGFDRNNGGDFVFNHIKFRNGNGKLVWGYLNNCNMLALEKCSDYPYGKVTINGTKYITFKFRRTENVYKADASLWGTVYSGARVACLNGDSGDSHPEWKKINYVEKVSTGEWVKVSGAGCSYGFVNTGLEDGAMPSSISMYGKW